MTCIDKPNLLLDCIYTLRQASDDNLASIVKVPFLDKCGDMLDIVFHNIDITREFLQVLIVLSSVNSEDPETDKVMVILAKKLLSHSE